MIYDLISTIGVWFSQGIAIGLWGPDIIKRIIGD